jgi:hypothetical protein
MPCSPFAISTYRVKSNQRATIYHQLRKYEQDERRDAVPRRRRGAERPRSTLQNAPDRADNDGANEHEVRLARRVCYVRFGQWRWMWYE